MIGDSADVNLPKEIVKYKPLCSDRSTCGFSCHSECDSDLITTHRIVEVTNGRIVTPECIE